MHLFWSYGTYYSCSPCIGWMCSCCKKAPVLVLTPTLGLVLQIPSLFPRALESFMRLPPANDESGRWGWVDRWLRCIPLDGEAQGFFSALPHR